MLMVSTGLRVGEAVAIKRADVDLRERIGYIRVTSKGGKLRRIRLAGDIVPLLRIYIDRLTTGDYLFPGQIAGSHITARTFQIYLKEQARRCGVDQDVTPHVLRHTFCKYLVDRGTGLEVVAAMAGHASIATTMRYVTPTEGDIEEALGRLTDDL